MSTHVFVYGTLKTGEPNHYWFEDKSHGYSCLVGQAETVDKFPLVIATKYNLPMLLGNKVCCLKTILKILFRPSWYWKTDKR